LRQALPALAAGVQDDPDVQGRRAAIDVLEALGRQAAPAAPALLAALADRDRFVRWAAARALGKVRPTNTETVIPALTRLLKDGDLNLELAAVNALCAYGPGARAALPALTEAVRAPEPEMRLAVMRALECIGSDEAAWLAVLNAALTDPDGRVRQVAGELLEKVGPSRREAANALLRPPAREGTGAKAVGSVRPR
jgi:HEAT repeat protein